MEINGDKIYELILETNDKIGKLDGKIEVLKEKNEITAVKLEKMEIHIEKLDRNVSDLMLSNSIIKARKDKVKNNWLFFKEKALLPILLLIIAGLLINPFIQWAAPVFWGNDNKIVKKSNNVIKK
jgi:hypothetical protein